MDKTDRIIDLLRKTDQELVEVPLERAVERYEEKRTQDEIDRNWWPIKARQELARRRSMKSEGR